MIIITCVLIVVVSKHIVGFGIDPSVSVDISGAKDAFKQLSKGIGHAQTALSVLQSTYTFFTNFDAWTRQTFPYLTDKENTPEKQMFRQIKTVQRKIDELSEKIDTVGTFVITSIKDFMANEIKLQRRLDSLIDFISRVDFFYSYLDYYIGCGKFSNDTIYNFAENVLSHDLGSVQSLLDGIQLLVLPGQIGVIDYGLFDLITGPLQKTHDIMCKIELAPQQLLYRIYDIILLTQLKGYIMMEVSYVMLNIYKKTNFTAEAELMRNRHVQRTADLNKGARDSMSQLSRDFRRCDPSQHIEDTTYIRVIRRYLGYVVNQANFITDTCLISCKESEHTWLENKFDGYPSGQCTGTIKECIYWGDPLYLCDSKDPHRRYEYIESDYGTYGKKQNCRSKVYKVQSWLRGTVHCAYCYCMCDETSHNTVRFFNMRPYIADIANNFVVTGLRFTTKNELIHLQIQEGKLTPMGSIDPRTVRWVPVEDYTVGNTSFHSGRDYFSITMKQDTIALDDLIADEEHVLTGIRFKNVDELLTLEIYASPFNFKDGILLEPFNCSVWMNATRDGCPMVSYEHYDLPTIDNTHTYVDSVSGSCAEFVASNSKLDARQSTLPFLDAQPVVPTTAAPLSGAGIFHKGNKKSAGFIAPKIIMYDMSLSALLYKYGKGNDSTTEKNIQCKAKS